MATKIQKILTPALSLGVLLGSYLPFNIQKEHKFRKQSHAIVQAETKEFKSIEDRIADFLIPNANAQEIKKITINNRTYTLKDIDRIMEQYKAKDGRYKVTEYLKDNGIELLNVDNYHNKVYNANPTIPKIVMPYVHNDYTGPSMREAIILKLLKEQFGDKIEYYGFDATDKEPEQFFVHELEKFSADKAYSKYPIDRVGGSVPSLLLYSPYDILEGETPDNNDGKIKLIDVARKAPTYDGTLTITQAFIDYWIKPNLLLNPTEDAYRIFNRVFKWTNLNKLK